MFFANKKKLKTLKESTRIEAPQDPQAHLGRSPGRRGVAGGGRGMSAGLSEPPDPILVTFERICNSRDPNYLPYIE